MPANSFAAIRRYSPVGMGRGAWGVGRGAWGVGRGALEDE